MAAGRYEISVACKGLKKTDVLSKSDPICIMYEKISGRWEAIGRTELLSNTQDPKWNTKFVLDFHGADHQKVKFAVYDGDQDDGTLKGSDFLGSVKCALVKLTENAGMECVATFKDGPSKGGEMTFNLEQINFSANEVLTLGVAAENLDKKDLISKSDPFFTISKQVRYNLHLQPSEICTVIVFLI